MLIDCDSCAARDIACGDCVVAVLLGPRANSVELDSAEQDALGAFASGGLLPPLRLVPTRPLDGSPPTERQSATPVERQSATPAERQSATPAERQSATPAGRPESDRQSTARTGQPRIESA